ncbi:MAG TPA: sulfatase-like hydrolase/transferase [Polyangiaceae bacterium]
MGLAPTAAALVLDLLIRGSDIFAFWIGGKAIYFSSWLVSAAFWSLPIHLVGRLFDSDKLAAKIGRIAFFVLFVWPLAIFGYGGQALYHKVFRVYVGRDTVRLGIVLRGTVGDWFSAWGGPLVFVAIGAVGALLAFGLFLLVKRDHARARASVPWLLVPTFLASLGVFWEDQVDSRFLQAALPDTCFVHGCMHALRAKVTGKWNEHQGVSIRTPAPLPPITPTRPTKPNVIFVITESVRADSLCSDPNVCKDDLLDPSVPDRIALGRLRAQAPNTFSACMMYWTGLGPDADFHQAHTAPFLWEVAHAIGYKTAYVSAQNPNFEDFGAYVHVAGIDTLVMGTDLGKMTQEQLGAPDERATAAMLDYAKAAKEPYFAVMQFSNTHAPYRTEPSMLPNHPESDSPFAPSYEYKNHYLNSVRLQMRTLAAFLDEMKKLPSWDDTVVVFVSDHGEELRDHGGLYHNHSLYEEQLEIPGFVVFGANALDASAKDALAKNRGHFTYTQDIHATMLDLLGAFDAAPTFPLADHTLGRSLLRPITGGEPMMLLSTSTSVWQPDDARFGVTTGVRKYVSWGPSSRLCLQLTADGKGETPIPMPRCNDLAPVVDAKFGSQMHDLGWR